MNILRSSLAAAALACSLAHPAFADTLNFTYTYADGNILSGVLTGTDAGNAFTVKAVHALTLNGVNKTAVLSGAVSSFDAYIGFGSGFNGDGSAVVTIDGSYMDFGTSPDNGITGTAILSGDIASISIGGQFFYHEAGSNPNADYPYEQSRWFASVTKSVVPEPASLALLGAGLAAMFFARSRRTVGAI